ncbi:MULTISPECIES: PepSY domain-containing protein [unclassified Beijerinckia]|uniref:PepSY domain-containing protein n=1 Tax=unclassified Beijerinckia TaxID=2638183 RepID=UPI0008967F04|nr:MULTISPECIES: PepSY domain-containing protein [unclassified Beijerinckia]MDH7796268.1 hypothetical protein [Beijerinckia sp. GAS462]SEC37763.1 Peptidase propeptide and YPEB domain-containing protein [Beijerinckia sp. 28-YEA-48]
MRPIALMILPVVFVSQAALADSRSCATTAFGQDQKMTLEAATQQAETLGYAVNKAKRSKGCWKIEGFDRNGAEIEIIFDPSSGQVVKPQDWHAPAR